MTLRLVLADDHPVVRKGLRALLEAEPDLRIAGEAADGLEAVKLVEQERPEVLIVDWMMPGLDGPERQPTAYRPVPSRRGERMQDFCEARTDYGSRESRRQSLPRTFMRLSESFSEPRALTNRPFE